MRELTEMTTFVLNVVAGLFVMIAGAVIKLPVALISIGIAKAVLRPVPKFLAFVIGVVQDAFGYVCAIWIANCGMIWWADAHLSWVLLIILCFLLPWLSWERMYASHEVIRWTEIGCNAGRVAGLILGGFLTI